jgi:hypothetical protein
VGTLAPGPNRSIPGSRWSTRRSASRTGGSSARRIAAPPPPRGGPAGFGKVTSRCISKVTAGMRHDSRQVESVGSCICQSLSSPGRDIQAPPRENHGPCCRLSQTSVVWVLASWRRFDQGKAAAPSIKESRLTTQEFPQRLQVIAHCTAGVNGARIVTAVLLVAAGPHLSEPSEAQALEVPDNVELAADH